MTEPITAARLEECRQLAAIDWPPGTAQHQLAKAVRDLGREVERLRDAARATPSVDAVAPEPVTLRSGRTVCKFHQLELPESGQCNGCAGDAKGRPDGPDEPVPVAPGAMDGWRGRELFRNLTPPPAVEPA